jgi:hypothetical protein
MIIGNTYEKIQNLLPIYEFISYLIIHFNASQFVSVMATLPVLELLLLVVGGCQW